MKVENMNWDHRVIFNPDSKTDQGPRFIPMSDRAYGILRSRCRDRAEGWVFPSRQKGKHITGGMVNKQWVAARNATGLPEDLVLYCARHDYGTYVLVKTGNLKLVMNSMGHTDVKTAMKYQHPELEIVRQALNARHILRTPEKIMGQEIQP
jgi:integrase